MKKLFLVEDDENFREILKLNLQSKGFECLTAKDGLVALEMIKEAMPDLVILDLKLPKLSGEEVCKKIKLDQATSAIPVIMLTGKSSIVDKVIGRVIGADCYLNKPCEIKILLENINNLIYKKKDTEK